VAVKPQLNKKMRMAVQLEKFKSGTILLPKQASWLANFEDELYAFPHSRHDDQIDALSQALAYEPPRFDLEILAKGMENLASGLPWQTMFRGRVV
jgi:hypothetical protein